MHCGEASRRQTKRTHRRNRVVQRVIVGTKARLRTGIAERPQDAARLVRLHGAERTHAGDEFRIAQFRPAPEHVEQSRLITIRANQERHIHTSLT